MIIKFLRKQLRRQISPILAYLIILIAVLMSSFWGLNMWVQKNSDFIDLQLKTQKIELVAFQKQSKILRNLSSIKNLEKKIPSVIFENKNIKLKIGNNLKLENHSEGYNGIWEIIPKNLNNKDNFIWEGLSAFNLEHFFNGEDEFNEVGKPQNLFEPRQWPFIITKKPNNKAILFQPESPFYHVESTTTFSFKPPCYIDVDFVAMLKENVFTNGWLGIFWATYVNQPSDPNIYFLGYENSKQTTPSWIKSNGAMIYSPNAKVPLKTKWTVPPHPMHKYSEIRWAYPFYYGIWRKYSYVLMLDSKEELAFYAGNAKTWNPWDFQLIIHDPQVGQIVHLKARIIFDTFQGNDWVLNEYHKWKKSLNNN